MRFHLRGHGETFELGSSIEVRAEASMAFRDRTRAEQFLRRFQHSWGGMAELRRIAADTAGGLGVAYLRDDDVIRLVAHALTSGRLRVRQPPPAAARARPMAATPQAPTPAGPRMRPARPLGAPHTCPPDFVVTAVCRIIKADGGRVQMTAGDQPGFAGGTFKWTTSSRKIRLIDPNSATVTVEGLAHPSSARDAEAITVTRNEPGCSPIVKTIHVTVATVTFSASTSQRYGYDDFDTPTNPLDDHVCVKKSDYTFVKVDIHGGATGSDFDFVCTDPAVCTTVPPPGRTSFDLRLNGGGAIKGQTTLHANCKCATATSFAQLEVHVYKERVVNVVVAKFDHTAAGANLRFPHADYAAHAARANPKLKEAVVKYNITNYDAHNGVTPVALASGGAVVSYDISAGGGADLTAIQAAMTGTGTRVRVAIVRDMRSYYYLSAAAAVGDRAVTVRGSSTFYAIGDRVPLGTGASSEVMTIRGLSGATITCDPLTKAHAVGEPVEFGAGGWGSDPILIKEGRASLDVAKWTVLHEVGHRDRGLDLDDIIDVTDFMHFRQSWTDYRLRYCPRLKKYPAGTTVRENQWEMIPRA